MSSCTSSGRVSVAGEEGQRLRERTPHVRLGLAVALGAVGLASAAIGQERSAVRWVTAGAWAVALLAFASALVPARRYARRAATLMPAATAVCAAAAAVALTFGSGRHWVLTPAAIAAWTGIAHMLAIRWTAVLGASAASMACAAIAVAVDARSVSNALTLLAYALGWLACTTAVVARVLHRRARA